MKKYIIPILSLILFWGCNNPEKAIYVEITNNSSIDRENEIVEIAWNDISGLLNLSDTTLVITSLEGTQIPYQLITEGKDEIQRLIFPATVKAGKTAKYALTQGIPEKFESKTYARYIPERKDDLAWENDKIAFRVYGPALIETDGPSNGIDTWVKSTNKLIIDKWYKEDLSKLSSYHVDSGEGVDAYKVGRTLGAGGMAPFVNDTLWLAENYTTQEILDNGPLRTTIRLTYKPFVVSGDSAVSEVKIISLDAGSYFNKITETYSGLKNTVPVAAGVVLKTAEAIPASNAEEANTAFTPLLQPEKGFITYAEVADKAAPEYDNGFIYTAVVFPNNLKEAKTAWQHALAIVEYQPESDLVYYNGVGWSKAGFASEKAWQDYVAGFAERIRQPLTVAIQK